MKTLYFTIVFLFILIPHHGFSQILSHGKVKESLVMQSKILGEDVKYTIYLPYDYETSERRYPVVYLLHGYSDDDTGWLQFGEANRLADKAIASGEIPPMILVMPDAKVTWYINDYKGDVRYEDMLIEELIPFIDKNYKTRNSKRYRALAGLSMGGYGSLVLAMHNPDFFSGCAAFSAAVWTDNQIKERSNYQTFLGNIYGNNLQGDARINEHWKKNSPLYLAKSNDLEKVRSVRFYLDCGDDDFLTIGNAMLHITMLQNEIEHEYRVRNGAHNWDYWRSGLIDGLKFLGKQFHQ